MLSSDEVLTALSRELGPPLPAPGDEGEHIFDLDGSLRLGVRTLPDGSGHIAWSAVAETRPGETPAESEARAAAFLGIHLGRLRPAGAVTATRAPDGADILFVRSCPGTEEEWLLAVEQLLNETEAVRGILSRQDGRGSGGGAAPGPGSLFSGMARMLPTGGPRR